MNIFLALKRAGWLPVLACLASSSGRRSLSAAGHLQEVDGVRLLLLLVSLGDGGSLDSGKS